MKKTLYAMLFTAVGAFTTPVISESMAALNIPKCNYLAGTTYCRAQDRGKEIKCNANTGNGSPGTKCLKCKKDGTISKGAKRCETRIGNFTEYSTRPYTNDTSNTLLFEDIELDAGE